MKGEGGPDFPETSASRFVLLDMFGLPEPYDSIVRGLLLTPAAVLWTVLLVRIVGLRAFSKMTAFDFVTTIASGSLMAQAATRSELGPFLQALAALGGIFLTQWLLARVRQDFPFVRRAIENKPVLLMEHGRLLEDAMTRTRVPRGSIIEKLRASNVGRMSDVRAVVLETTGDITVLTGEQDAIMLEGVQRTGASSADPTSR